MVSIKQSFNCAVEYVNKAISDVAKSPESMRTIIKTASYSAKISNYKDLSSKFDFGDNIIGLLISADIIDKVKNFKITENGVWKTVDLILTAAEFATKGAVFIDKYMLELGEYSLPLAGASTTISVIKRTSTISKNVWRLTQNYRHGQNEHSEIKLKIANARSNLRAAVDNGDVAEKQKWKEKKIKWETRAHFHKAKHAEAYITILLNVSLLALQLISFVNKVVPNPHLKLVMTGVAGGVVTMGLAKLGVKNAITKPLPRKYTKIAAGQEVFSWEKGYFAPKGPLVSAAA